MQTVNLSWKGPFNLKTANARKEFLPPNEAGVYLFCVGTKPNLRISYIGKSGNVKERLGEHLWSILGGRYELYSDRHLLHGDPPNENNTSYYPKDLIQCFIGKPDIYMAMALNNVKNFQFFWATNFSNDDFMVSAVESAIIHDARELDQPLQTVRLSVSEFNCPRLHVKSSVAKGAALPPIPRIIEYGKK